MQSAKFQVVSLDHLVLTVADIGITVAFYESVLGMKVEEFLSADGSLRVALTFGAQKINLHRVGGEFEPKAATPRAGSADLCFLSERTVADWARHLESMGVAIEMGPVRRTGAQGPILSIYLRDPDQNLIEIANRV